MIFYVFTGAVMGALLRLGAELLVTGQWFEAAHLMALFIVNAVGCYAFAISERFLKQPRKRVFWLTGCWGTFTSFSAVSSMFLTQEMNFLQMFLWALACVSSWWLSYVAGGMTVDKLRTLRRGKY